jgi:adenosylcobyric acid synthase
MDALFPAEDSLDLMERRGRKKGTEVTIGVIRLPRISNFTDFDPLEAEPTVGVKYLGLGDELDDLDAVILPGSKTTIPDLLKLQAAGMADRIQTYIANGGTVLGVCGGFQMLGQQLDDADGLEGESGSFSGLGLLPFQTVMAGEKIVRQRQVKTAFPQADLPLQGYEIHLGRSQQLNTNGFEYLFDDPTLGVVNQSRSLWGTYLHGIFDSGAWRRMWLNHIRQKKGLKPLTAMLPDYIQQRNELIDRLADHIERFMDLRPILPHDRY